MTPLNDFHMASPDDLAICHHSSEVLEKRFTETIGCIEDTLMDEKFLELRSDFMERHWQQFEDSEENKLVYTEIFRKYQDTVEKYIEEQIRRNVQGFDMCEFELELEKRQNELDGEIFEIIATFSDFLAFKNMFLDYKNMKEGKVADFSEDFSITKCNVESD